MKVHICPVCNAATDRVVRLKSGTWRQTLLSVGAHLDGFLNAKICIECQQAVLAVLKQRDGINQGRALAVNYNRSIVQEAVPVLLAAAPAPTKPKPLAAPKKPKKDRKKRK